MKLIIFIFLVLSMFSCRKDKKEILKTVVSVDANFIGNWTYINNNSTFHTGIDINDTSGCHFTLINYYTPPPHNQINLYGTAYLKDGYIVVGDSLGLKVNHYPNVLDQNDTITLFTNLGSIYYAVYSATMTLNSITYHRIDEWIQ